MTHRAAVVGAGPAGFYTTDQLLNAGWEVDLYDALPTPFGLVRSGVAPDHPKLKSVTRIYDKTAAKPGFRFFGGVELGRDVTREELLERYHAVVYAVGTGDDNRLGIPGEDRPGSHSATEFVAWYNGHPDYHGHQFDLSGGRAVVIGNGNVAIDVARMLVLDPSELAPTDTADHAIEHFGSLDRRRGDPARPPRARPGRLHESRGARARRARARRRRLRPGAGRGRHRRRDADRRAQRRDVPRLRGARAAGQVAPHRAALPALPDRDPRRGRRRPRDRRARLGQRARQDGRAVPTGEEEVIECGLVLRSIGYRGRPLDGIPWNEQRGLIANEGGRVAPGEYCVGWIKRGPSGVIGTNKKDAADTVARILEDEAAGTLGTPASADADEVATWLAERVPDAITWEGWQAIDAAERAAGEPQGRPRVKLVTLAELREAGRLTPAR